MTGAGDIGRVYLCSLHRPPHNVSAYSVATVVVDKVADNGHVIRLYIVSPPETRSLTVRTVRWQERILFWPHRGRGADEVETTLTGEHNTGTATGGGCSSGVEGLRSRG